ncbi:MAG: sulfatase-modifying factor protein [Pseudanabaena frigida]|uniref:Sulfatase-modifying factor protein n=1 Tax=Pseudanabaena frigida TaxID=945775 RepID=A0A2W4XMM8_9CYAN|nr:MAG: sulfatase-modifying factor protein [Pseudanabaena frigida]
MKRLALLVGTSEYPEREKLPPLHGSLLDVDAMQRVLVANGEFATEDVVVLKNASRQVIEDAIHNLFNGRNRQKDDLVLFYFSGHGIVDEANKLFLGTPSTRKEGNKIVKPTTVAANYLQEAMNDSKSQHQVLIFNCCFSGAFAQGMTVMDDSSVNLKSQLGGKGRAILTSSSSTQFSFQPDGEMSIYTRYLVEGIETGAADRDGDRKISVDELHEYAALKVSQESPNMTPAFYPVEQGGKIYIAKVAQSNDDPRLIYRRELESRIVDGKWSIPARRLLDSLRVRLELSAEDAEGIKSDVLKPILAKVRKLEEYEELLKEMLAERNPPSTQELKDLRDYQKDHLRLRDEDVADIDRKHELIVSSKIRNLANNELIIVKEYKPQNLILDLPNGVKLELVDIPAGSFSMGSDDYDSEKPIHKVTLPAFKIGKYPITQKQYQSVMGNNPSNFKGDNLPVEKVSWDDAIAFCKKISKITGQKLSLPSEAQWEYACRSGSTGKYCFGDDVNQLEKYAWYDKNSGSKAHLVGEKLANSWRLHDMHGNVWEWCEDLWHGNYKGAPTDGTAWLKDGEPNIRSLRGGSCFSGGIYCRSAYRGRNLAGERNYGIGFRVVV